MRFTKLTSFRASAAVVSATTVALLTAAFFGVGRAGAQPPVPTPTPSPAIPQKPLPTQYKPPIVDASGVQVVTSADKQSPLNPFPYGGGNAQARGVGGADPFWGIVNANVPWNQTPLSRVPNLASTVSTTANIPLGLDGWSFTAGLLGFDPTNINADRRDPRANDPRSGSRNGVALNQTAAFNIDDQDVYAANSPQVTALWLSVTGPPAGTTGPSQDAYPFSGPTTNIYTRTLAVPRPNTPALQYITQPNPTTNPNGFRWKFNDPATTPAATRTRIPGGYGEQARFRISVKIPQVNGDDTLAATEGRIGDARYFVYYYIRSATTGAIIPKVKIYTISQLSGDTVKLINDNGAEAFFPFFTYNTENGTPPAGVTPVVLPVQPSLGIVFQGVIVDNTTGEQNTGTGSQYVLADALLLTSGTGTISSTPTIVGPHGGRKASNYNVILDPITGLPAAPGPVGGTQPKQPRPFVPRLGVTYNNQILNEPLVSTVNTLALTNDSFTDTNRATGLRDTTNTPGYVNNPRDPIYDPANTALYDVTVPFESWNPSTLFMGPEALLDPVRKNNPNSTTEVGLPLRAGVQNRPLVERTNPLTGAPVIDPRNGGVLRTPGNASDANNFNVYGGVYDTATNGLLNWTPYYSQMQVIVARTEFVPDPESNVADDQKDGTLTIQVGAVYALDWQTGAPIWRFPDKTYLPGRARNPRIFKGIPTDLDPARRQDMYQIPGIVVLDKNGNGSNTALDPASTLRVANDPDIEDEEVFIGQQLGSSGNGRQLSVGSGSGALFASITYAPRVSVQGNVQLPTYQISNPPVLTQFNRTGRYLLTNAGQTVPAPTGRYFTHASNTNPGAPNTGDGRGKFEPVLTGMLYIAASNGVVYAVDAFGNNDNYYSSYHPNITNPQLIDNGVFGNYQPGTTNVLWTFSPTSGTQRQAESRAAYFRRLKAEVPAPSSFGASAPVLAYRKDEHDNTSPTLSNRINPFTDELRLFVGNQNGVLYALDASANAGQVIVLSQVVGVRDLPFRKGDQVGFVPDDATAATGVAAHRADLKWWFRSRSGAINYPPTVSLMKQNSGGNTGTAAPLLTKGVYFTSQEGRVYCVDFDGPVTRQDHNTPVATATGWDGTAAIATLLNDDYYFHNTVPATATARPDLTEGDVRPRWAWPNLYRQTQAGTAKTSTVAPDFALGNATRQTDAYDGNTVAPINVGGVRLGVPEALGPPTSSPVLMDFIWKDPLVLGRPAQLRSYVAVVMDDPITVGGTVTGSRVYLLDQVGDRVNFLSGTQANRTGTNAPIAVRGQFIDRWTPSAILSPDVDGITPTGLAWTYRTQYDVFPGNGNLLQDPLTNPADLSGRNSPTTNPRVLSALPVNATVIPSATNQGDAFTGTDTNYPHYRDENYGRPERRTLPTLFVGGAASIFGLDIDPETGIFMRWRPSIAEMARVVVLPVDPRLTGTGTGDDLYPGPESTDDLRPIIVNPDQYNDPFNGSAIRAGLRDRRVLARSITLSEETGTVATLSLSGGPLQNRNNLTPIQNVTPPLPTVPTYPTNDAPILRPFLLTGDPAQNPPSFDTGIYGAGQNDVRQYGLSSRVNQDINDPITTTRGSLYSDVPLDPTQTRFIQPETTARVFNQAYQYPALFATSTSGLLHEVSSNIEGEDFSTVATLGFSSTVGWGFQGLGTLERRYNTAGHVEQFLQDLLGGASGPVSGVAIVTPAYFPALDPSFLNPERVAAPATTPTDNYPNYPYGSPNITGAPNPGVPTPPIPVGVTAGNNDDPRPDLHVRPLSPGALVRPGPDGMLGTTDDIAAVLPDRHTGQTGFPLDLNGLFFDKRFAGQGTRTLPAAEVGVTVYNESFIDATVGGQAVAPVTPIVQQNLYNGAYPYPPLNGVYATVPPVVYPPFDNQDANGDYAVGLRLPAYSDIGTALDTVLAPVARLFNNQQPDGLRANRRTGNLVPLATEDPTERSLEPVYLLDPLVNATRGDDINPAAQNVAWIYTGGANGILYAYTPAIPGQQSGLAGGAGEAVALREGGPQGDGVDATGGTFQVDLFSQADYNNYASTVASGSLTAPDRKLSIAAKGGKNFYEWGETAYIIVSSIPLGPDPNNNSGSAIPITVTGNVRVRVTIKSRFGGPTVYDGTVAPARYNNQAAYYLVPNSDGSNNRYGVVLLPFKLDKPTTAKPLTPGDVFEIAAVLVTNDEQTEGVVIGDQAGSFPGPVAGAGSNFAQQALTSPASSFAIANPIAVQGFATQTAPSLATGQLMPVGVTRTNAGDTTGGVGPFFSDNNQLGTGNGTKGEIVDSTTTTKVDPDKIGGRYSQALTQGNTLLRRDLTALIQDTTNPAGYRLNPRFPQILKDPATGGDEPKFYFPVASGVGYVDHGTSGSTTNGKLQNLRVVNRSVLASLPGVRIQPVDPLLWHAWPGMVPNTEGDLPAVGTNPALVHNNPRLTPVGMDLYGRINPLPWETGVNENEPYNSGTLANQSPDYPDILLSPTTNAPRIFIGGSDVSTTTGSLPANITDNGGILRNTSAAYAEALYGPSFSQAVADNMAVSVSLTIPKYQSANIVAIHTLTSIYVIANQADDPAGAANQGLDIVGAGGTPGPVQLPRGYAARLLKESNTAGTAFSGPQAIAPWGYSTKMAAYVDFDNTGRLYPAGQAARSSGVSTNPNSGTLPVKAFREFEVWVGVPAAMSLQMVEKEVDLGAEGHGFAMQNGLLGYGTGGGAYASGFLPTPLYNAAAFPAVGTITPSPPYSNYYKPFTVQNTGNINLWNLRSSQKIESPTTGNPGSGQPFFYFGMRSDSVDSRFGILAVGVDPILPFMPQVATSLDPAYDDLWDAYVAAQPAYQAQYNGAGSDPYTRYYAGFKGHHPLHKPLPGATGPTVLGIPDVPSAQSVYDVDPSLIGAAIPAAPTNSKSVVGVAVPLGTPSGLYRSNLASTPLVVFEDHDTTFDASGVGYRAVPSISTPGNQPTLTPAGPLYGGRNNEYFADPSAAGGVKQVQTRTGVSDGTLRARRLNGTNGKSEYQPYTAPTFDLRVTVKETGLTGQAADRALAGAGALPPVVSTGVLPGADVFPMIQTTANGNQITGGDLYRAASALTPAAYRSANGKIHVYWSRNVDPTTGNPDTAPGKPFNLFASHLNWNENIGVFVADNVGVPIAATAFNNTAGRWFSAPSAIAPAGAATGSSNVTPYVLQEQVFDGNGLLSTGSATLFFTNSTPTVGGAPVNVPYFASLDANGALTAPAVPYFSNASPTLQRYAPRAAYVPATYEAFTPNTGTTFLFYYGGVPGRWSIYYSPRAAGVGGTPTDGAPNDANGRAEVPLTVPAAIVSASDPTPVVRRLIPTSGGNPYTVVDMYYTGVSRATQTPDVYMTRYTLQPGNGGAARAGQNARLVAAQLPRVFGEKLTAPGRDPVWQGRHISWYRDLGEANGLLPVIYLSDPTTGGRRRVTNRRNWRYDNGSGLLYQTFQYDPAVAQSLTTVYVDASAGTVRFRGAGTPRNTDSVYVDYQPQTYRITSDGASNAGTFAFLDQSTLFATPSGGAIIKRNTAMYADRQYVMYQKGAQPGKPATLYYSARRVGVDLKTVTADALGNALPYPPLAADETIALDVPTGPAFNSTPQVSGLTVGGYGVPYDVDISNGRIFVAPPISNIAINQNTSYENLTTSFTVNIYKASTNTTTSRTYSNLLLSYLDERRDVAVPMTQAVNESQPYAFLDTYLSPLLGTANRAGDPTLQSGKVWLFWSTPRGREGTVVGPGVLGGSPIFDPFPSAYDVFWQTLAPQFDPLLYTIPR